MSVSQPALGFTLSPSPVVLTSIVAFSGALVIMTGLTALRDDKSLRRFANAALGKDERAMSVILSAFQTAWRDGDVNRKRFLFIESSPGEPASSGNTSFMAPTKPQRLRFSPSLSWCVSRRGIPSPG